MQNNITYFRKNDQISYICYKDAVTSYPMHTHANHFMLGHLSAGMIRIDYNGQKWLYRAGEYFCIMPDTPHAILTVDNMTYSMMSICIAASEMPAQTRKEIAWLKQSILSAPENLFFIEEMARCVNISPYHMIRQFKSACGLTPHQFQIQCRVRKAQKLLEEGKSVAEAAYETGFCDQSHLDRCFRKIVRLTPNEYKTSVKIIVP